MKAYRFLNAATIILFALIALIGCIAQEPLELQCDLEKITLTSPDGVDVFTGGNSYDFTLDESGDSSDLTKSSCIFLLKDECKVGSYIVNLKCHAGSSIYLLSKSGKEESFTDGSLVDFVTSDSCRSFITYSAGLYKDIVDGQSYRSRRKYDIYVMHDTTGVASKKTFYTQYMFNGNYALESSNQKFYIWSEEDGTIFRLGDYTWKNGNPGYTLSKGSAKPMEYPTVPEAAGGMDGSDCLKLETMSTGSFGKMVNAPIAAGSLFNGNFNVANATKAPRKSTLFGVPCRYIPDSLELDIKYIPGTTFQDINENPVQGVVDEPDIYCVFYKNHGQTIVLDGDNVVTSSNIVALARLKHHYTCIKDGNRQVPVPELSGSPIHGITDQWQHVGLKLDFDPFKTGTENVINLDTLKAGGYSVVFGSSSSWRGAVFEGAIGSRLYIDNIRIKFTNPFGDNPEPDPDPEPQPEPQPEPEPEPERMMDLISINWQSTNPMFKVLRSGAKDDEMPFVAYGTTIKLVTCPAGTYSALLKMHDVAGIIYNGVMDTYQLQQAVNGGSSYFKSIIHVGEVFTHKPLRIVIRARYTRGAMYYQGNTYKSSFSDSPDIFCVFYRNNGGQLKLSGDDLFTNSNIVGYARLYGSGKIIDTDWTDIEMEIPTDNVDLQELANGGYSVAYGAMSSWDCFNLSGAQGSTLEIGNIVIYYE